MQTSLINNDDVNGLKGAAIDLSADPESLQTPAMQENFETLQGAADMASMSSRLREERATHYSIQTR